MTRSMLRNATIAGCFMLATGVSFARAADTSAVGKSDAAFVKAASAAGLAEVNLGNLATQKGGSDDIKAFGKTMVTDPQWRVTN